MKKMKTIGNKSFIFVVVAIGVVFLVVFGVWAGLTKAGYIPNYFEVKMLNPDDKVPVTKRLSCLVIGKKATRDCGPLVDENGDGYIECGNWKCVDDDYVHPALKPVIYLYPEKTREVRVNLDYEGELIATYPEYSNGWEVTARPDGTLVNHFDNREYSYLFWEGESEEETNWDLNKGFVVRGKDTREFLREKLAEIGLTPKEYNEFIVYWYPRMKDNKYNLIHFAGEEYTDSARLEITPEPDSMLRVFMVYKPLDEYVEIEPQVFETFKRNGFSVVEWGGTLVN